MKNFYAFNHPKYGEKIEKDGFTFLGLIFPVLWLLTKKLYKAAAWVFIASLVAGSIFRVTTGLMMDRYYLYEQANIFETINFTLLLFTVVLHFIVGSKGRSWVFNSLTKRGFELEEFIPADNKDAAFAKLAKIRAGEEKGHPLPKKDDLPSTVKLCPSCSLRNKKEDLKCRYCGKPM